MPTWGILVAAGDGRRFGADVPKALVDLDGRPLFTYAFAALSAACDGVVVVGPEEHLDRIRAELPTTIETPDHTCEVRSVAGGPNRQASAKAGLALVPQEADVVLVHDAARPLIPHGLIATLIGELGEADAAIPGFRIVDTVKRIAGNRVVRTEDREGLATVETPQAFRGNVLRAAHAISRDNATDDAALVEASGGTVRFVELAERGIKVTTPDDLAVVAERLAPKDPVAFGTGDDVHALVEGRPCRIGCVELPHDRGPEGHSDGDPVAHAICDALLGAAGLGDLGTHFPSDDDKWKGATGSELLAETGRFVRLAGFDIGNVDATVLIEKPRVAPYRAAMQQAIASVLGIDPQRVSVKATTADRLGLIGRGEAVAAHAVVSLRRPRA